MNIFNGIEINTIQFVGSLIVLAVTMFFTAFIFRLLFKWLPTKLLNYLTGPAALVGAYIWVIPMNMGFYDLFK